MSREGNAYDEGQRHYLEGRQMWNSPHIYATSEPKLFVAWLAGWMLMKQIDETGKKNGDQPIFGSESPTAKSGDISS